MDWTIWRFPNQILVMKQLWWIWCPVHQREETCLTFLDAVTALMVSIFHWVYNFTLMQVVSFLQIAISIPNVLSVKKSSYTLHLSPYSKLSYIPPVPIILTVISNTGDMPKFSETQKLQNKLKQCHILSEIFEARNWQKSPFLKIFLETKKNWENISLPTGFLSQEIGRNHTIVPKIYKHGIVSTYSVTFRSQKILACLQCNKLSQWITLMT